MNYTNILANLARKLERQKAAMLETEQHIAAIKNLENEPDPLQIEMDPKASKK